MTYAGLTYPVNVLSTTTGIDAKTAATTNLYTVPAGKTLIPFGFIIECTAQTAITVGPDVSFGKDPGTSDFGNGTTSNILTTSDVSQTVIGTNVGTYPATPAGSIINATVTNVATGTAMTLKITTLGILI